MIDAVATRIAAIVPSLTGRVEGAAQLADLMARNALPQVTPAAFVVPLGLQGGAVSAATGLHIQMCEEVVGVVIALRSFSATGGEAMPELDALIRAVVHAVAGWAPGDAIGAFRLLRGGLLSMRTGTMLYQLDFALPDQLRIPAS